MKELKLGVIGLSEGNGHPYSWSAICNGYDSKYMKECPFPVIFDYLEEQSFPEAQLDGVRVTHIWTQDQKISENVARASKIENIVGDYKDMIGDIDALLLARDDAETHFEMAKPFLEADLPVYIDKPVALSTQDLQNIMELKRFPGQIFSCSALQFSKELELSSNDQAKLGDIKRIYGKTPKSWDKYAVHIIEPILRMFDYQSDIAEHSINKNDDGIVSNSFSFKNGIEITLEAYGANVTPIEIRVEGTKSELVLRFSDSFTAFREAIRLFILGINEKRDIIEESFLRKTVELIERGRS